MPVILAEHAGLGVGQTVTILRFPDIPKEVVRVHRVMSWVSSFSASTAFANVLAHNVSDNFTLQTGDLSNLWCRINQAITSEVPYGVFEFDPAPYELVGPQRWVSINSAGIITAVLAVVYSIRKEPNLTLWTELRARTSFERS